MAKRYGVVRAPSVRNVGSSLSGPFTMVSLVNAFGVWTCHNIT